MKPIIFNTLMVRAILDGKKTQTRRLAVEIKSFEISKSGCIFASVINKSGISKVGGSMELFLQNNAPYKIGDTLYVRETWQESECFDSNIKGQFVYKANKADEEFAHDYKVNWRPSIHMPKKAARIFLKVTNIRIERVHDISEEDALKEGIRGYTKDGQLYKYCVDYDSWIEKKGRTWQNMPRYAKEAFLLMWNDIYKNWIIRPWVWVIEFERVKGESI